MGEKEEKGEEKQKKGDGEKKEGGGGGGGGGGGVGGKKEEDPPMVVLKVDMHCEGCAKKIKRSVKTLAGVESVKADTMANKLTVFGKADPWMVKERVEAKIRRKVDIISPANTPKKADAGGDAKKPAAGDAKKPDDKKPKPPAVSTVLLKIRLHCEGCTQRIRKAILKIKGVDDVSIDTLKDLVTVKGTMDAKSLPAILKEKLRRTVEIVQPKKDDGGGEKKEKGDGEKKEKGDGGGGEKKEKGDGGEKKDGGKKDVDGGEKKDGGKKDDGGEKKDGGKKDDGGKAAPPPAALVAAAPVSEVNMMDYYGSYGYRVDMAHAPQLFSDENPNACSIM